MDFEASIGRPLTSIWEDAEPMTTLRRACEADVPAMIELAKRSWLSAFVGTAPESMVCDRHARDFEREWYPRYWSDMTIAEDAGVLLGVVQPMHDEVNGLWVDPEAQGRGVGTVLLRHAENLIAAAGHRRSWLTCSGFNPKAVRFYLARGYQEIGCAINDRGDGVLEMIITMERRFIPDELPGPIAGQSKYT